MHIYVAPLPPIYLTSFMHDLQDSVCFCMCRYVFCGALAHPLACKVINMFKLLILLIVSNVSVSDHMVPEALTLIVGTKHMK